MATDTCKSVITFEVWEQRRSEPFQTEIQSFVERMFNEGKTLVFPNHVYDGYDILPGQKTWADRAAAQEFIDYSLMIALAHNINILSTAIEDLRPV